MRNFLSGFIIGFVIMYVVAVFAVSIAKASIPFDDRQTLGSVAEFGTVHNKSRHLNCIKREGFNTYIRVEGGSGEMELKDMDCQYISTEKCFEKPESK